MDNSRALAFALFDRILLLFQIFVDLQEFSVQTKLQQLRNLMHAYIFVTFSLIFREPNESRSLVYTLIPANLEVSRSVTIKFSQIEPRLL